MLRRCLICLCLCWLLVSKPALAQGTDILATADNAIAAGDLVGAQQQLLSILAAAKEPDIVGAASIRLSHIAQLRGDLAAAETPLREALKRLPAGAPAAQPASAAIYLQLGAIALARGDTSRAQLALMKGIAIGKRVAPNDPLLLEAELTLTTAEIRAFLLTEATARLAGLELSLDASSPRLNALYQSVKGELFFRQYDYEPALAAQRKAREIFSGLYGRNHAETARVETALGSSLFSAGQYAKATTMLQHAVAIYDQDPRFYAPALAVTLVNLGQVYYATGRTSIAIAALDRAVTLAQQSSGQGGQTEATALLHRGYAKLRQNDLAAASTDLRAAMNIWSKPETGNRRAMAGAGVWLAEVERRTGRFADAESVLDQSATILTDIFGAESYAMSDVLLGRAELAMANKQPQQAITLLDHALGIRTAALGSNHIASLDVRSIRAMALAERGDVGDARQQIETVTAVMRQRIAMQSLGGGMPIDEVEAARRLLGRHVVILDQAQQTNAGDNADIVEEAFAVGQLARASAAGRAISDLGQRQSIDNAEAAKALRLVQEDVLRWQMAERALSAQVVAADSHADLLAAQRDVERLRVAAASATSSFAESYPAQAAKTAGSSASVAEIREALHGKEVLLSYLTLEDKSFLWVVTKQRATFASIDHDDFWFGERIRALRATVNPKAVTDLSDILPFATDAAADLYAGLIAPAHLGPDEAHLIIVPDGTLQSLPFATLLSRQVAPPEDFAGYRELPWLIRDHDIAILPEVGALLTFRSGIRPSAAKEPFLGIGDPLLAGTATPEAADATTAELLRSLPPLPEAADELSTLAAALQAPPTAVVTSTAATEAMVKSTALQNYRVIAFATHGLVAGDFGRLREPGLVLTPPSTAEGPDDGLLTAGEIAELKLDADWVILSACNTAAADGTPGAEGLSGLARGFFFAGSRALLVSQWEVLSVAAVQLTTGALQHLAREPQIGKAAALRLSILDLLAPEQEDYLAHPIFWAPFELVGEGAALLSRRAE
ncbi:MAG: CHAT domain-containing protein [Proteobacteria bacterium]|nr:CHAT domain-containing protein [Pseudomonadota bacterium]